MGSNVDDIPWPKKKPKTKGAKKKGSGGGQSGTIAGMVILVSAIAAGLFGIPIAYLLHAWLS